MQDFGSVYKESQHPYIDQSWLADTKENPMAIS